MLHALNMELQLLNTKFLIWVTCYARVLLNRGDETAERVIPLKVRLRSGVFRCVILLSQKCRTGYEEAAKRTAL